MLARHAGAVKNGPREGAWSTVCTMSSGWSAGPVARRSVPADAKNESTYSRPEAVLYCGGRPDDKSVCSGCRCHVLTADDCSERLARATYTYGLRLVKCSTEGAAAGMARRGSRRRRPNVWRRKKLRLVCPARWSPGSSPNTPALVLCWVRLFPRGCRCCIEARTRRRRRDRTCLAAPMVAPFWLRSRPTGSLRSMRPMRASGIPARCTTARASARVLRRLASAAGGCPPAQYAARAAVRLNVPGRIGSNQW